MIAHPAVEVLHLFVGRSNGGEPLRMIERLEAGHGDAQKLHALRQAVTLPDDFVKDALSYDSDPARVRDRRRLLASALTSATH